MGSELITVPHRIQYPMQYPLFFVSKIKSKKKRIHSIVYISSRVYYKKNEKIFSNDSPGQGLAELDGEFVQSGACSVLSVQRPV